MQDKGIPWSSTEAELQTVSRPKRAVAGIDQLDLSKSLDRAWENSSSWNWLFSGEGELLAKGQLKGAMGCYAYYSSGLLWVSSLGEVLTELRALQNWDEGGSMPCWNWLGVVHPIGMLGGPNKLSWSKESERLAGQTVLERLGVNEMRTTNHRGSPIMRTGHLRVPPDWTEDLLPNYNHHQDVADEKQLGISGSWEGKHIRADCQEVADHPEIPLGLLVLYQ